MASTTRAKPRSRSTAYPQQLFASPGGAAAGETAAVLSPGGGDKFRVAVRLRPTSAGGTPAVDAQRSGTKWAVRPLSKGAEFTFDKVFTAADDTQRVYEDMVRPLVDGCFAGYSATVFAYGQTASGKTHTMLGSEGEPGVLRLALSEIIDKFQQVLAESGKTPNLFISFFEIYQNKLWDLVRDTDFELKVVNGGRVFLRDNKEYEPIGPVTSVHEIKDYLVHAAKARKVKATKMNANSSRSHAVFSFQLRIPISGELSKSYEVTFNFVDLAGSERLKKAGDNEQAGQINTSLFCLHQLVTALAKHNGEHLPFRDSVLTRLLQPSLEGNARVVFLCCIADEIEHAGESAQTLQFAKEAEKVKCDAKRSISAIEAKTIKFDFERRRSIAAAAVSPPPPPPPPPPPRLFIRALSNGGVTHRELRTIEALAASLRAGKYSRIVVMCGFTVNLPQLLHSPRYQRVLDGYALSSTRLVFDRSYFVEHPEPLFAFAKEFLAEERMPRASHSFIKELDRRHLLLRCFTENLDAAELTDGIPEQKLAFVNGVLSKARCLNCGGVAQLSEALSRHPAHVCPHCKGLLKPDVALYGEKLPEITPDILSDMQQCDLVIAVGVTAVFLPFSVVWDAIPHDVPCVYLGQQPPTRDLLLACTHQAVPACEWHIQGDAEAMCEILHAALADSL
eukprot:TRINITY_DN538_c0_g2_i1.p1 TRINITY_DN538_c0_g2~~TRINITY_DN538_c0_g2_i1.p1  ORF type:complete len:687 (-),score=162.49 TRINITY_DN538_c0_g2_i1:25-2055(-)